jgi:hypothetical protein
VARRNVPRPDLLLVPVVAALALGCGHRRAPAAEWSRPPNEITHVAFGAGAAYATTVEGHIQVWDLHGSALRLFDVPGYPILARDGSVSVNVIHGGGRGDQLDVWDLASRRRLRAGGFAEGIDEIVAVSRAVVLLRLKYHQWPSLGGGVPAMLPPRSHAAAWDVASGRVDDGVADGCYEHTALSADGRGVLCASAWGPIAWVDRQAGRSVTPPLAPDWYPPEPPPPPEGEEVFRGKPHSPDPAPFMILSTYLTSDGACAYVAYRGEEAHRGWRLERWRTGEQRGWERLASVDGEEWTHVLAASADGRLVVLGGRRKPLTVRRAPGYAAERVDGWSANAAAVSPDGGRILTGHEDGRLMLWDAATLAPLASAR